MSSTRSFALAGGLALSLAVPLHFATAVDKAAPTLTDTEAQALVQQALDNELAGDAEGRQKLLERALARDPQYPAAHWHLGNVRHDDQWLAARQAMAKAADSPLNAEYQAKRDEAAGNSALELKLAQWCLKERMPDRARLHFWRVLKSPKVTEDQVKDAAKQLDLVSVGGTILTRDELKQEQEREKRIAEAIAKWRPILAQCQPAIDAGFDTKHEVAAQKLATIDNPSVIPAIETYVNDHQEGFGEELVKLLMEFPQVEATQTLVRYAVVSPFLSVRERAISELKKRPLHDYVPTLLAGLVAPLQSKYQFQRDARGNIRYQRVFVQETPDATLVRHLDTLYRAQTGALVMNDGSGARRAALINWQLDSLLQAEIEQEIARHKFVGHTAKLASLENDRVIDALTQVSGQQLPPNPQSWWNWWQEYNQVHYPRQTYRLYASTVRPYLAQVIGYSCFTKGTVVWAQQGQRPIESIQPGDRVLSQDPDTGELCFKVVASTTLRPPAEVSKLTVNGETITTTLGHPLWVAGKGWEMAKHINAGDQLHGINGIVNVNDIQPLPRKAEAHNLVVDDFNTYFVGNCGMLVHDNTSRKPTRALLPGLIPDAGR